MPRASNASLFQLTRPLRGATAGINEYMNGFTNFNSHAPCGARRSYVCATSSTYLISTHTPLAGRDVCRQVVHFLVCISTHTPLAGRDHRLETLVGKLLEFQLTRPLRGATLYSYRTVCAAFISTHTPLAGRDYAEHLKDPKLQISTHTPLAGRDQTAEFL